MRRVFFVITVLALLVSGVSFADETETDLFAEDIVPEAQPTDASVCNAGTEAAAQIADPEKHLEGMMRFQAGPSSAPNPPPCPTSSTCVGGSNKCTNPTSTPCQANGLTSRVDTGQVSCTLPSGVVGYCFFGTIHIYTTQCGQCPCCSTTPACLCPINCGQAVTWRCA